MTVKRTGGAFNPADRHLYFAAGNAEAYPHCLLRAVNDIDGPADERRLVELLDAGHKVLLDSGVFWLTNRHARAHNTSMDEALALPPEEIDGFTELYSRYVGLVHRYGDRLWGFIELDQGGRDNKRRTRARLESDGITPMPVYHPFNDGWDYFDELAAGYDRICFGNIVQASPPTRLRLLHTMWERHRDYPDLWIHVLGLTVNPWCLAVPPDSCDSSTWLAPMRWAGGGDGTAMLRRAGRLVPGFSYDSDASVDSPRGTTAGFRLCAETVDDLNQLWTAARQAAANVTGLPAYPPRRPQEPKPCPR